jgi:hypothetical protein
MEEDLEESYSGSGEVIVDTQQKRLTVRISPISSPKDSSEKEEEEEVAVEEQKTVTYEEYLLMRHSMIELQPSKMS